MRNNPPRQKAKYNRGRVLSCLLCAVLLMGLFSLPAQGAQPQEEAQIHTEDAFEMPVTEVGELPVGAEDALESPVQEDAPADELPSQETTLNDEPDRWWTSVSDVLNTTEHSAYISGYSSGVFQPNAHVTRAEAVQMFYSLLLQKNVSRRRFFDTDSAWYTDAVETIAGMGIINGYSDGGFHPNDDITRAEFTTIAVGFDTLSPGEMTFSDVPATSWAAPYISSAAGKGWVSGMKDGTFHPNDKITRAEAVTILNKLLGRTPDTDIEEKPDAKNFFDVFPDHWAYGNILEAATTHSYYHDSTGERWLGYDRDLSEVESGWVSENGAKYYIDAATRKALRGEQKVDGETYFFDASTGAARTGFQMVGGYRRYYKNGKLLDDISGLGLVKGPYFIKVYKNSNYLIIFAKDSSGKYNTPVRAMRVSCGTATPTGTYYTPDRYRWLKMVGDTWAQWCTQILGSYLFHSVPNYTQNNKDLEVEEYNHLGDTRSLGCIRLNCRDAKWIYDNCALGTKVEITTAEAGGPLKKPDGLQIPSWHTWDPTDPTAAGYCKARGCH